MTSTPEYLPLPPTDDHWRTDPLRVAVAGYLARHRGETRRHAESDLRAYLTWCAERRLNPLDARRPHIELYERWTQETRHDAPSTVSRRMSIVACFYRTGVVDDLLEHSPADYVLGLLDLRIFEACALDIADLGEEHGHRVLESSARDTTTMRYDRARTTFDRPQLHPRRLHGLGNLTTQRFFRCLRTRTAGAWSG
jgi:integrase/recombinase XerD